MSTKTHISPAAGMVCSFRLIEPSASIARRLLDVVLAAGGLVVFAPFFMLISLAVWLEDGGLPFYGQERVGKKGKVFKCWKFRSMVQNAESNTGPVFSSTQDSRITKVGAVLRATAMDELPQLWNILVGDMSVVGPRAERPCFVAQFKQTIPGYDVRHLVRPGLTGLAQVYGRYNTDARDKLRYDLILVKDQSLRLMVRLIAFSFWITFRGKWTSMTKQR